jgi:hypothetical protein
MALEDDVEKALLDAGNELKKDLWQPADLVLITARAKDLVGLNAKAEAAQDANIKAQYRAAANSVVDHVKLLALLRMQVAENDILEALGRLFMRVVIPALAALLTSLFRL